VLVASPAGLEPATSHLADECSFQLSYGDVADTLIRHRFQSPVGNGAFLHICVLLSQKWNMRQLENVDDSPKLRYEMPAIWTFQCYLSERGVDEIRAWYCGQPPRVRGKFLSRLRTLSQLQPHEWGLPYFRWLHGECEGLGEIRFEVARVQHRPLGYSGREMFFTLVLCAREANDRLVPRNACATGLDRKATIRNDGDRSHACWLVLE
jgi:hypothetical protein